MYSSWLLFPPNLLACLFTCQLVAKWHSFRFVIKERTCSVFMIPLFATQYRDRIVGAMQGQTIARLAKQAALPVVLRKLFVRNIASILCERCRSVLCDPGRTVFVRRSLANFLCERGRTSFASGCPERSEGMQDRFLGATLSVEYL